MTLGEPPSPEKVRRGSLILGLLAVAAAGAFFADEVRRELSEGPTLWIAADETRGLAAGAPVWIAGHRAGRVTKVELRPPTVAPDRRVLIRAVIRETASNRIRADASAVLEPAALLAPTVVSIRPGGPGAPAYDFSDTLEAGTAVSTTELRAQVERAGAALDSLRRAEARVLALADTGGGTAARLRRDAELRRRLRRIASGLRRLEGAVTGDRPGTLALLRRPEAAARLRAGLAGDSALSARLDSLAGRWRGVGGRLRSLRARADSLSAQLRDAGGSAGRFLHDRALQRELAELRRGVTEVRAELLSDPFRWLRFVVF